MFIESTSVFSNVLNRFHCGGNFRLVSNFLPLERGVVNDRVGDTIDEVYIVFVLRKVF